MIQGWGWCKDMWRNNVIIMHYNNGKKPNILTLAEALAISWTLGITDMTVYQDKIVNKWVASTGRLFGITVVCFHSFVIASQENKWVRLNLHRLTCGYSRCRNQVFIFKCVFSHLHLTPSPCIAAFRCCVMELHVANLICQGCDFDHDTESINKLFIYFLGIWKWAYVYVVDAGVQTIHSNTKCQSSVAILKHGIKVWA